MNKLLLIDGHSVAYRAFFGLPPENFQTSTGQHTNAVFGFTSMLINLLRDEQPTHLAVAFDVSRHSFRTDEYPEYKATRSKSPDEFRGQVELIKEVLDALAIAHIEKPGYEADDLIATLSTAAASEGFDVAIVTGDRDALQLVTDRVTLLYPRKGVSDLARLDPDAVEAKYLVRPERYPELAALVGETSDNLPGVPGVGPKTAAKWLAEFDGLENLIASAEQVRGKAGANFREHLDDVVRNRRLNALVRTVDVDAVPSDFARQEWDRAKVEQLFDALEFRVLRARLQELGGAELEEAGTEAFEIEGETLDTGAVEAWLKTHSKGLVGAHFSGDWSADQGRVAGIGLAASDGAGAFVDTATLSPDDDRALAAWLADAERLKVTHDVKGPMRTLPEHGWELAGVQCDTMLAGYLLHPEQRSYALEDLVLRYLRRELSSESSDSSPQLALDFGDETDAQDAMLRARATLELATELEKKLDESQQRSLLNDLELPLMRVLATMERTGIAVDQDRLRELRTEFDTQVSAAQDAAYEVLGHEVNLGSPKQLQAVLFDELGMPKTKRTKSGYTTSAEALTELFAKTEHPFLEHLLNHRDRIKLRQTVDGLISAVAPDGRIHTTYQQTIAATGRLSSTEPNLQNIPIRTELGRKIRTAFVPGEGYEALMSADYSQIEMRLMADGSGDAGMIDAFLSGRDFHTEMASKVFHVEPQDVTGEMRSRIKAMNYGLAYGLSAYGLSNQLKISVTEAKALMDDYFARVGGVRQYLADLVDGARTKGYTQTMLGRRRYLPDLGSSNRGRREMAERAALNAPIQGSAADVIKLAMLAVDEALRAAGMRSRVLLQVHDELVLEIAPGEGDEAASLITEAMGGAADLTVPLAVSIGSGDNWQSAAH